MSGNPDSQQKRSLKKTLSVENKMQLKDLMGFGRSLNVNDEVDVEYRYSTEYRNTITVVTLKMPKSGKKIELLITPYIATLTEDDTSKDRLRILKLVFEKDLYTIATPMRPSPESRHGLQQNPPNFVPVADVIGKGKFRAQVDNVMNAVNIMEIQKWAAIEATGDGIAEVLGKITDATAIHEIERDHKYRPFLQRLDAGAQGPAPQG